MTSFDHVPVEEFRVNFMWDIVRAPTFKNSINFLVVQNVHLDPKIRSQSSGLNMIDDYVGDDGGDNDDDDDDDDDDNDDDDDDAGLLFGVFISFGRFSSVISRAV